MTTVTTSIVIEFDSGDADINYIFTAEVDGREDGLNNGNTSFKPGDPVYILLYRTPNTVLDGIIVTHGNVNPSGGVSTRKVGVPDSEFAQFIATDSTTLTYPVVSNFIGEWVGDNSDLGVVQVLNNSSLKLASVPKEADGVTPKEHYAGVYEYSYTTDFQPYLLKHNAIGSKDKYQIIIYIYGHSV